MCTYICIYIYIYICVCVCVCVWVGGCVCVSVYVCVCVSIHHCGLNENVCSYFCCLSCGNLLLLFISKIRKGKELYH